MAGVALAPELMQPMPSALDIEQAVLGALIVEPEAVSEVADILTPAMFYDEGHACLYAAILKLYRQRIPVDLVTIVQRLRSSGEIERAGGAFAVTQLGSKASSSRHIATHALLLVQYHIKREQIRIGHRLTQLGHSETADPFDAIADAAAELRLLNEHGRVEARNMAEVMTDVTDMTAPDRSAPFGFDAIDRNMRLESGAVTIIGARPGMGKTAFLLSCAWRQANAGLRPYIVQLEMKSRNMATRLACGELGIPVWKVKRKQLSEQDIDEITRWQTANGAALERMVVDETSHMTTTALAARVDRAKRKHGVDVVWVDYIGLLSPSTKQKLGYDHMTAVSRELRIMAKDFDVPFAVLSQLSRPVKGSTPKAPSLTDLRDSGAIEQDAEAVCFLHRPKYYDPSAGDEVEFVRAKNRDGNDGRDLLHFDGERVRMTDMESGGGYSRSNNVRHEDAPF